MWATLEKISVYSVRHRPGQQRDSDIQTADSVVVQGDEGLVQGCKRPAQHKLQGLL
jgi:hypothetical protein